MGQFCKVQLLRLSIGESTHTPIIKDEQSQKSLDIYWTNVHTLKEHCMHNPTYSVLNQDVHNFIAAVKFHKENIA